MARRNAQPVPVALGGGINKGVDPNLLGPPHAATAQNVVTREQGGYQKLPGATAELAKGGGGMSVTSAGIMFRTGEGLAIASVADGYVRSMSAIDWSTVSEDHSMAHPLKVSAVTALSLPGEVAQVAIAHNDGYTAVGCRHRPNFHSLPSTQQLVWVILDDSGEVVGGPWYSTDGKEYPRIEPIDISGSPGFCFMGLHKVVDGTLDPFNIVACRINTSSMPSPGLLAMGAAIGTLNVPSVAHAKGRLLYDSSGHASHNRCYVTFYNGTNTVCVRTDGSSVSSAVTVYAGEAQAHAVWFDNPSQTVLVYRSNGTIYYDDPLLGGFANVAGAHTTTHPIWYYSAAEGNLYIDGEDVNITGSNPGTPSFAGTQAHVPAGKVMDPQGFLLTTRGEAGCVFFRSGSSEGLGSDSGHSWLDATFLTTDDEHFTMVPIGETHQPLTVYEGVTQNDASASLFVQPQASFDTNGRIFVPVIRNIAASRGVSGVGYTLGGADDEGDVGPFDYWDPNTDRYVGYVVLDPRQASLEHTAVQHQGTTIIAAGNVGAYDGREYFDFLAPPEILEYDDAAVGGPARSTMGQTDAQQIASIAGGTYTHINWWAMKVVLVYTDKNGIEWRSAPSGAVTNEDIAGTEASGLPVVKIGLDDSHRRILRSLDQQGDGTSFDVEFYVTARDDGNPAADGSPGAATEAAIIHEYYLAHRMPLLGTAATFYYIFDPCLASYQGLEATGYISVPLYTDQNELAPVRPPASHILAAAGNYLFLVPSESPWEIWPTKPLERGRAPEFAPELIFSGPPAGGKIISLAGQGDRLIVLCEHGVWELFVGGSGPDANGQGSFGQFRSLHPADGCISHRGTVSTPQGVLYMARSGPKLVTGDGGVQDVGRAIQGVYEPDTIRCGEYHQGAKEAWLSFEGGTAVLNLTSMTWTTVTVPYTGLVYQGGFLFKWNDDGTVMYEHALLTSGNSLDDGGASIQASVVSPWLTFSAPGGWHRARWLTFSGRAYANAGAASFIRLRLAYDYNTTDVEEYLIPAAQWASKASFRLKPARQKFDAIRVTIEDTDTNGDTANYIMWGLSSLVLEVETKMGLVKLAYSSGNTHTTS